MNNLLIDEPPLQVLPSLACKVGLNEAIVLQQFHYWLKVSKNERDGYKWIYNSYKEWNKQFPFWSEITLKRAILKLEKEGYLISGNYNKAGFDKTKWYRIDYTKLMNNLCSDMIQPSYQNDTRDVSKRYDASYQNDTTYTNRIPKTTTENTTKRNIKESQPSLTDRFETLWKLYPKKQGKKVAFNAYKRAVKKGTTDDEIKQGIANYKKHIKDDHVDYQFIKQGSSWFNQESWEDDYTNHSGTNKPQEPMSNVDWKVDW